jgi:hypothetical protein
MGSKRSGPHPGDYLHGDDRTRSSTRPTVTSPGYQSNKRAEDEHEEEYRQKVIAQGGGLLGRAKEYRFDKDPIVPLGDERFAPREEGAHARHRREHQPAGGTASVDPMPFANLISEKPGK